MIAVHRRADLVAHGRQEGALGLVGLVGGLLGLLEHDVRRSRSKTRPSSVPMSSLASSSGSSGG